MDINTLKGYWIELGFNVDQLGLSKFNDALRHAQSAVAGATSGSLGIATMFTKAAISSVAALASISAGAIALAEHAANTDLQFGILARRMYMNKDAAREMKIATDALGISIEDALWGPKELGERFHALVGEQKQLTVLLGPDFEKQMRTIRDVRFEFTKLEVAVKYLGYSIGSNLANTILGDGKVRQEVEDWVQYVITNMPRLSREISGVLAPVLKDTWGILVDVKQIAADTLPIFLKMTGAFFGDPRLKEGQLTIENIGLALQHVADAIRTIFDLMRRMADFIHSNPYIGQMIEGFAAAGSLSGRITKFGVHGLERILPSQAAPAQDVRSLIRQQARSLGIPEAIALSQAERESGFNQAARGSHGEIGVYQLMPRTATGLGVNPYDLQQNIRGGLSYLAQQYGIYHDWKKALEAYNAGARAVDRGMVPNSSRTYAEDILRHAFHPMDYQSGGHTSSVINVGGITVNVMQPSATAEEIKQATMSAIETKLARRRQRNLLVLGGVHG